MSRQQGVIKFWNHEKGGFIKPDAATAGDVFVHVTALPSESILNVGDKVLFEIEDDPNGCGKKAARVERA